jgi:hypothetical protein
MTLATRVRRLRAAADDPTDTTGTASRGARRSALLVPLTIFLVGLAELGANSRGLWWVTVLAGVVVGVAAGARYVLALAVGTVLAWGVGIVLESGSRTVDIAGVVSAMALGARGLGWAVVVLTLVYAVLLALAGCWLGAAARRLLVGYRGEEPARTETVAASTESAEIEEPDRV